MSVNGFIKNSTTYKYDYNALDNKPVADTTLAISGAFADAKAVGDTLGELRNDVDSLISIDLAKGTTFTADKSINYSTGEIQNAPSLRASGYVDITGCEKILYNRVYSTASSPVYGVAFYDSNKTFISGSGIRAGAGASSFHYEMAEAEVPTGAAYIRYSTGTANAGFVYDYNDYYSKVYQRLETVEARVADLETLTQNTEEYTKNVTDSGYYCLPLDNWELGGYQGYSSKDSRKYRVRYKDALSFNRDVYILADAGYYVAGYKSDNTTIEAATIIKVPANTSVKIYSRRYTENVNEEISDITPFAKAIKLSTNIAQIEADYATFTDVSMFERVGISGDSYAAGGGIISGITSLTWGKNLERQAGITVDIYAKSGESIMGWVENQTKGLPALLNGTECGLYWFQHGINGTGTAESLGTAADMSADPHPNTFYGKYVEAIEAVQAAFPNARIVLATIVGTSYGLSEAYQYSTVNTAIKAIAEYCEVPCIDITEDDFFKSLAYSANMRSNHPTAMVAAGMAMAYRRLLAKCILKNASYFISYGST